MLDVRITELSRIDGRTIAATPHTGYVTSCFSWDGGDAFHLIVGQLARRNVRTYCVMREGDTVSINEGRSVAMLLADRGHLIRMVP